MRAVEHGRLGRSGAEVDKRSPRAGDVGHPAGADFRHADDIAHLSLAPADRKHLGPSHAPSWTGREDFKERRESRAARLEAAASRRSGEARDRFELVGRGLPDDGQPILVGHHSEGRHRRALERSDMNMRKSVELQAQAAELSRRAAAAENNSAISSDDPEAIAKLEGRIADLEAEVVQWKDINKAVRSKTPEARLNALGFSEEAVMRLLKGDSLGRKGVPDYKFKNQNGNIRRLKTRLAELRAAAALKAPDRVETAGGSMTWDTESNRIIIRMPAKALTREEKTRRSSLMRSYGFVWAPTMGSYVRQASATGWHAGRAALKEITELP
ncbi:DUF3560 domain-containing protein [Nannocystis pusilla]|uniref:DUF3560 domain-containing protein n=1 Tax=Nannocystis pusilla TaxID=889268 RepID=UPI003B80B33C